VKYQLAAGHLVTDEATGPTGDGVCVRDSKDGDRILAGDVDGSIGRSRIDEDYLER
jgi:hypothetical protein